MAVGNGQSDDVLKRSVTQDDYVEGAYAGGVYHFMLPMVGGSVNLPAFWSYARDWMLYSTIYRESMWAAAVYIAVTKQASKSWEVESDIPQRQKRAQQLFLHFDNNKGWVSGISKHLQSYCLTGNGGIVEIVRATSAAGSRVIGLVPLDPFRTIRTGDASIPFLYRDRRGAQHELRDYDAFAITDQPDLMDLWYGVGHCLHRESYVRMADGTNRKIAALVRERSTASVASVDKDGKLVSKRIIGWHENPIAGRQWVNIRGKNSSRATGKVNRNLDVTEDHPILTPNGWVEAIEINTGDEIVTEFPYPNPKQLELIIGSVLGDMSILQNGGNARMTEGHHIHQADWLRLKAHALRDFRFKERTYKNDINISGRVTPGLNWLRELCYRKDGKKSVPPNLVEKYLSPLLLVAWYLDDGWIEHRNGERNRRPTAQIGNSGAEYKHTDAMVDILNRAGYECRSVSSRKSKSTRKDIHFTANGSVKFFRDIAPYVPEAMRYKLPCDSEPFNPALWNLGHAVRYVDTAIVSIRKSRSDATVYCLDIEDTHAFISSSIIVHNCAAERAFKAIEKQEAIERYIYEKVSGERALALDFIAGVLPTQVQQAQNTARDENASKGVYTYMGSTIIPMAGDIEPKHVRINLAELPDGFDRKQEFDLTILSYARALGIPVQDLQPLSGQGLGTGAQTQVLEESAKGQGMATWPKSFNHNVNEYSLDEKTTFYFRENDIRDREREAKVKIDEATAIKTWVDMQAITIEQARQLGVDRDQLPAEFIGTDLTAGGTLSDIEKPTEITEVTPTDTEIPVTQPTEQADNAMPATESDAILKNARRIYNAIVNRQDTQALAPVAQPIHSLSGLLDGAWAKIGEVDGLNASVTALEGQLKDAQAQHASELERIEKESVSIVSTLDALGETEQATADLLRTMIETQDAQSQTMTSETKALRDELATLAKRPDAPNIDALRKMVNDTVSDALTLATQSTTLKHAEDLTVKTEIIETDRNGLASLVQRTLASGQTDRFRIVRNGSGRIQRLEKA